MNDSIKVISLVHISAVEDKNNNQKATIDHYSIKIGDWFYFLRFNIKNKQIKTILVRESNEGGKLKLIENLGMIQLTDDAILSTGRSLVGLFHSENINICLNQDWFFEYFCLCIGVSVKLNDINFFESLNINKSLLTLKENKEIVKFLQESLLEEK